MGLHKVGVQYYPPLPATATATPSTLTLSSHRSSRRPPIVPTITAMDKPSQGFKRRRSSGGASKRTKPYQARVPKRQSKSEEVKFFDTANSWTFDATGEVPATGQLTLIPQGDTESTRDGRKAVIKSVQIRGVLTLVPGAGATPSGAAYLYLVLDRQANGAAAAVTDVFTSVSLQSAMLNLNNSARFYILKKWSWAFNPMAGVTTAYNNITKIIDWYKKCDIPIDWNSTAGAITEIRSNNLFFIAGSQGQDDTIFFEGVTRLRFVG